ncbi:2TM domain-containing protein [Nonlabens xiamenensis]|uniref:2TM domain-containing protein n=1 Tax=Nonlabens xiamenensis TaxID=2341043 RepID=UPI000F613576|nr:2TM domain-containing protein [Nonlabens xiamenensis]
MTSKRIFRNLLAAILIAIGISLIDVVFDGGFKSWSVQLEEFSINLLFSVTLTFVNQWFFDWMDKHFSWLEQPAQRLIYGAVGSIILTMLSLFLLLMFMYVVIYDVPLDKYLSDQSLEWYTFGLLITIVMSITFHAVYFYRELNANKVKEQKSIARSATLQFDALKNQLDPHFLFNSLNVLVSLIEENPKAATKFTTSLSKVYRYVLEQRNKDLVSIQEELKFADTYVSLLKTRFEDSIQVDIENNPAFSELMVVPLSLQLLLENAVKHNVISDTKPLQIRIYQEAGNLVVENSLQVKPVVKKSSGVGLNNIAARYQLFTDRKMSTSEADGKFKVQIPILDGPENVQLTPEAPAAVEDIKLVQARERVSRIKSFYDSIAKTVVIVALLSILNFFSSDFPWVIFPALGMSLGLFFRYLRTFSNSGFLGRGWEERKIQVLLDQPQDTYTNQKESYKERYNTAKKRVEEIRSFYYHLMIYIVVNLGIASFNYYQNQWSTPWFVYTLAGWGLGLLGHAYGTFGRNPFTNKQWQERKLQEFMEE